MKVRTTYIQLTLASENVIGTQNEISKSSPGSGDDFEEVNTISFKREGRYLQRNTKLSSKPREYDHICVHSPWNQGREKNETDHEERELITPGIWILSKRAHCSGL
jgi:hypothetical protein